MCTPLFERARKQRVADNNRRLLELGVVDAVAGLHDLKQARVKRTKQARQRPAPRLLPHRAARPMSLAEPDSEALEPQAKRAKPAQQALEADVADMPSFLVSCCGYGEIDKELPGTFEQVADLCSSRLVTLIGIKNIMNNKDADIKDTLRRWLSTDEQPAPPVHLDQIAAGICKYRAACAGKNKK